MAQAMELERSRLLGSVKSVGRIRRARVDEIVGKETSKPVLGRGICSGLELESATYEKET